MSSIRQISLSRFTPSMMNAEALEQTFVQRRQVLERLERVLEEDAYSKSRHHTLIVGARGTGKTHLLSVLNNRLQTNATLEERVRIAWLREEEWGITSLLDLLIRILQTVGIDYSSPSLMSITDSLTGLSHQEAELSAQRALDRFLESRLLVVIVENLDELFGGLEEKGQQKLRALLQNSGNWTVIASTPSLFAGVLLRDSPFFGFFDVIHLRDLTLSDAVDLVAKLASLRNDQALAAFTQSEQGRARLAAVHHLAGGNHRLYVILAEFLSRDSLDELVDAFLRTIDNLTPYYQSRMASLSHQQRKIVDFLCTRRGAITVKAIAAQTFISSQTASSQLKVLREKGFVRSTSVGRDSFYEIAEPLMRIALEVKKQRSGPVRLLLDFLKHWYTKDELIQQLKQTPNTQLLERDYLLRAVENDALDADSMLWKATQDFVDLSNAGNHKAALELAQRLVQDRGGISDWNRLGHCLHSLQRHSAALDAFAHACKLDETDSVALLGCWVMASQLRRHQEALESAVKALEVAPSDLSWREREAYSLSSLGKYADSIESFDVVLALEPNRRTSVRGRAWGLFQLGRIGEAIQDFTQLTESPDAVVADFVLLGWILASQSQHQRAIEAYRRAHQLNPNDTTISVWLSRSLRAANGAEEAIALSRQAATMNPTDEDVWEELAIALANGKQLTAAAEAARAGLVAIQGSPSLRMLLAHFQNDLGEFSSAKEGFLSLAKESTEQDPALLLGLSRSHLALGEEEEGYSRLRDALRQKIEPGFAQILIQDLVQDLVSMNPSAKRRERLRQMSVIFEEADQGSILAVAGISVTRDLVVTGRLAEAQVWFDDWSSVGGDSVWLSYLTRLMRGMIDATLGNTKALLELPQEERRFVESMLAGNAIDSHAAPV
jgi:tetratricopeptide (TPR) repeat protein